MTGNLEHRLDQSTSVASLRAELEVTRLLTKHRWVCSHGAFYSDPNEGRLRELDVIGRQMWKRQGRTREDVIRLHLLVEVKSARDWQVVFAPSDQPRTEGHISRVWAGYLGHDQDYP
jgi:hypothetical protein